MEYSRKMVLVPEDRLQNTILDHLSDLDKQMNDILRKKNLSDSEKATLYLQVLQKYVNYPATISEVKEEQPEKQSTLPTEDEHQENPIVIKKGEANGSSIENELLKVAPVKLKADSIDILNFIKTHSKTLTWTATGEIIYKDNLIPRTNIVELINAMLRKNKKVPTGKAKFLEALKEMNIPLHYIRNPMMQGDTTNGRQKTNVKRKTNVRPVMFAKRKAWLKL